MDWWLENDFLKKTAILKFGIWIRHEFYFSGGKRREVSQIMQWKAAKKATGEILLAQQEGADAMGKYLD